MSLEDVASMIEVLEAAEAAAEAVAEAAEYVLAEEADYVLLEAA